jgi:Domain of unknown function (DUF5916)
MRIWASALCLCLACSGQIALAAKNTRQSEAITAQGIPQRTDSVIPLIDRALHLSDFPNMAPRADLRGKLTSVTDFIQGTPDDGSLASEKTEVWMAYTKTTVYFVFVCHDSHPNLIRNHLARRENIFFDDNVSVLLDPFHDRRIGVYFSVNPSGVQADASWSEGSYPKFSYDTVWDSEGRMTKDGWMALVAIPFRSIRFSPNLSDWGVVFARNFPRNSERDFWPRVAANISGTLSQEGTLHGIEGVSGSHNLQFNPYTLAQNERRLDVDDPANPFFSSRHLQSTTGGEAKLILKDSFVLDTTVNPDFSDVESDQPQFTVDQRYSIFFPELRQFFLENSEYFSTPIDLVYTRNIAHPSWGVRFTGKSDDTNVGIFATDDRQPGDSVAPGDPLYKRRTTVAVGRVSQDLGTGSNLGVIYTDREFGQGWNRIGGADFTARMDEHWTAKGQILASSTMTNEDGDTPAAYSAGPAGEFHIKRAGHSFEWFDGYSDFSTGFQTQLGFIQSSNIRHNFLHTTYQWFPKDRFYQSFGIEVNQETAFDHPGNRVLSYSSLNPYWELPRRIMIAPYFGQDSDTVSPTSYTALTGYKNFTENFGGISMHGAPWSQFNFNLQIVRGGNVNYNPAADAAPSLLDRQMVSALFTLQPVHQLTIDNTYLLDRNFEVAGGAFAFESQAMRSKVNYQFTRALSARVTVEFDPTLANPAETSLLHSKQVSTQALLTWLPHPGTAVYFGYTNDLQNIDRSLCNRLSSGICDPDNTTLPRGDSMLNDGKQIFLKASYLFRF